MFPIRDTINFGKFPFVNLVLILINLYFFFQLIIASDPEAFIFKYALIPAQVSIIQTETFAPFITSMFLHGGFFHIISNMWFLWIFGDNIEAIMGHTKYLIFYLFCGIAASFVQYIIAPNSILPIVGASGAIAGILGAYLKFFPRNKIDTIVPIFGLPLIIALPANFMLVYWFFTQAFNGAASIVATTASAGGIAYAAHAGGFTAGLLTSRLLVWQRV